MFKSHYQGGVYVEIFSAQGKDPAAKWAQSGKVQRIFDKSVRSYVYMLEGGPSTKMQVPKDEKLGLSLTQQFVVLQLSVPLGVGFNVQILATDTLNSKRRIFLSSAHRDISHTPLHTRLPLGMMTRGQWVNLAINVASIVSGIFSSTFKSVELICISASCKLRKVFTMRHQPHNTSSGIYTPCYDGPTETIPKACTLNIGTTTQVIDISVIRQWVENQLPKVQRGTVTKSAPQNPHLRAKPAPLRNAHSAEHHRKVQSSVESGNKQKTAVKAKRPTKQQQQKPVPDATPSTLQQRTSRQAPSIRGRQGTRVINNTDHVTVNTDHVTGNHGNVPSNHSHVVKNSNVGRVTPVADTVRWEAEQEVSPVKHSTPNPLMDRVLDVSFDTVQSKVDLVHGSYNNDNCRKDNDNFVDNKDIIRDIADGNLTFRSSSSSQRSSNTPKKAAVQHSSQHPMQLSSEPPDTTATPTRCSREPPHSTTTPTRRSRTDPHNASKVYNSKDYEDDNPFAASDEDLKYRMKALALYNGDLDDSMDFSTTSRKSKRSLGVGPVPAAGTNQSDDEIEEKLGEDTDTSSSDGTVLSHAQEALLSGSIGHTSFLQDSIGKSYESRLTDRAYSPPICYPDELTRQATLPHHNTTLNNTTTIEEDSGEEELDLLYDPVLNCYFDPKTCKYYELA